MPGGVERLGKAGRPAPRPTAVPAHMRIRSIVWSGSGWTEERRQRDPVPVVVEVQRPVDRDPKRQGAAPAKRVAHARRAQGGGWRRRPCWPRSLPPQLGTPSPIPSSPGRPAHQRLGEGADRDQSQRGRRVVEQEELALGDQQGEDHGHRGDRQPHEIATQNPPRAAITTSRRRRAPPAPSSTPSAAAARRGRGGSGPDEADARRCVEGDEADQQGAGRYRPGQLRVGRKLEGEQDPDPERRRAPRVAGPGRRADGTSTPSGR